MWIPLGRPQKTPLRGRVVVWYVPFQGEVGHVGPWTAGSGRLALGPRRGEIGANVPIPTWWKWDIKGQTPGAGPQWAPRGLTNQSRWGSDAGTVQSAWLGCVRVLYDCKRISCWIDRRLTGLAGPDYDAPISFGLPFESEDCQYGKSRLHGLALSGKTPSASIGRPE